jgi:hypothetical protein
VASCLGEEACLAVAYLDLDRARTLEVEGRNLVVVEVHRDRSLEGDHNSEVAYRLFEEEARPDQQEEFVEVHHLGVHFVVEDH